MIRQKWFFSLSFKSSKKIDQPDANLMANYFKTNPLFHTHTRSIHHKNFPCQQHSRTNYFNANITDHRFFFLILGTNRFSLWLAFFSQWEPTNIFVNFGQRSRAMLCASSSVSVAGNIANSPSLSAWLIQPVQIRPAASATRPSRATLSTASVSGREAAGRLPQRTGSTVRTGPTTSTNWPQRSIYKHLLKTRPASNFHHSDSLTHTGSTRMVHTSTTNASSSIHNITPSNTIQRSTGSAAPSRQGEKLVVSHQLERSTVDLLERAKVTERSGLQGTLTGRSVTQWNSIASVKFLTKKQFLLFICFFEYR